MARILKVKRNVKKWRGKFEFQFKRGSGRGKEKSRYVCDRFLPTRAVLGVRRRASGRLEGQANENARKKETVVRPRKEREIDGAESLGGLAFVYAVASCSELFI